MHMYCPSLYIGAPRIFNFALIVTARAVLKISVAAREPRAVTVPG